MAGDDSSDLSSLSSLSPAPSNPELDDSEPEAPAKKNSGILKFFNKLAEKPPREPTPPPRKRSPSPPHEYVIADNPDIAFAVMFRSRFSDAFPKSLAHFGPQELERDVIEPIPGDRVEHFLCAVLGLLLNRKQDVKPGHYGRALEDAISSHRSQWPRVWQEKSPLSGGATFNSMIPTERLTLLRTLILWAMCSSDVLKALINQSYKQNRHEDDLNQPRSVQPWGSDADKRRYFLVEGQDDTHFRVYRESNPANTITRTWWSVAGSMDELRGLAEKLETKDGGPKATKLAQKMLSAIPRFEQGEEKRRRREYRQMRKEQFKRPEPGFSMYEGRTRGKRIKYTYSDDEDAFNTDSSARRSNRNTGTATPAEGPVTTMSGRHVRAPPRLNPVTGETGTGGIQGDQSEIEEASGPTGRSRRQAARSRRNTSAESDSEPSEAEYGDDEHDDDGDGEAQVSEVSEDEDQYDADEAMVDDDLDEPQTLVVKLKVTPPRLRNALTTKSSSALNALPTPVPSMVDSSGVKADVGAVTAPEVEMKDAAPESVAEVPQAQTLITQPNKSTVHNGEPHPNGVLSEDNSTPVKVATQAPKDPMLSATALAFRGSPEKPQQSMPVNVAEFAKPE